MTAKIDQNLNSSKASVSSEIVRSLFDSEAKECSGEKEDDEEDDEEDVKVDEELLGKSMEKLSLDKQDTAVEMTVLEKEEQEEINEEQEELLVEDEIIRTFIKIFQLGATEKTIKMTVVNNGEDLQPSISFKTEETEASLVGKSYRRNRKTKTIPPVAGQKGIGEFFKTIITDK